MVKRWLGLVLLAEIFFQGAWDLGSNLPTPGPDFTAKFPKVGLARDCQMPYICPPPHHHLNLTLDQKFHLLSRAHHSFEINVMPFVLQSLIFMAVFGQMTLMTYWRRANQSDNDRKSTPPPHTHTHTNTQFRIENVKLSFCDTYDIWRIN